MTFSDLHSPTAMFPLPDRITGKLPITHWAVYFHILTARLEQELPGCDTAEYINLALGHLQIVACGNAALGSLAEFRKHLERGGSCGVPGKSAGKCRSVKAGLKRCWKRVFDF